MLQTPLNNRLIHVHPLPGRRVIDPFTGQPLPAGGATVACSPFYARRLRAGDVELLGPTDISAQSANVSTHAEEFSQPAGGHEPLTEVEN